MKNLAATGLHKIKFLLARRGSGRWKGNQQRPSQLICSHLVPVRMTLSFNPRKEVKDSMKKNLVHSQKLQLLPGPRICLRRDWKSEYELVGASHHCWQNEQVDAPPQKN